MVIGVTGGIGSGKSTVLEFLRDDFNAQIIMADDVAKELMIPGTSCFNRIVDFFGEDILTDGEVRVIDSKKLGAIVFNDEEKLKALNSIVHPSVKTEIENRIKKIYEENKSALIFLEAALLIEAGYLDILDELWVIVSDLETRIKRLISDRNYTRDKCLSIIDDQLSDEEFISHADFVVNNSDDFEKTKEQIRKHLKEILK